MSTMEADVQHYDHSCQTIEVESGLNKVNPFNQQ